MMPSAIFMIEGGRALEMVKEHIAERARVHQENCALLQELGCESYTANRLNGAISGVVFPNEPHPEFRKPDHAGISYPKKNTNWYKRIKAQKGWRDPGEWIVTEFNIPTGINYKCEGGFGGHHIGGIFNVCGFLFFGERGPYAMWMPDVPAAVAEAESRGYEVSEPEKSFAFNINGGRRIEREEWEILVLQHKLKQKRGAL